jgi:hypothetical protein
VSANIGHISKSKDSANTMHIYAYSDVTKICLRMYDMREILLL